MKNWKRKEAVRDLRKQGLSYKEIILSVSFNLAKSTVSDWCKDIELTNIQKDRLVRLYEVGRYKGRLSGAKTIQYRRRQEIEEIKKKAAEEVISFINDSFKIAGLMLYWAEGSKTHRVGITNSDTNLISFMMEWLRKVCKVENKKFKVHLHLHSGHNEIKVKKFWSEIIKLPVSQFGKTYIKKEGSGHRKNKLYNGTIKIEVCSKNLLYNILGWIEGFYKSYRATDSTGRVPAS